MEMPAEQEGVLEARRALSAQWMLSWASVNRSPLAGEPAAPVPVLHYDVDEGGGAFYGPKIDIKFRDAIGREWHGATIQLDFVLPERFELEYIGPDNQPHRPVMIHRAILGTMERFVGGLIEHFAGAFPVWLAPEQVRIIPITDEHIEGAREIGSIEDCPF